MIARITKAYTRHYRDSGITTACVEFIDSDGTRGRTEGVRDSFRMTMLIEQAKREGVRLERESGWLGGKLESRR